MLYCVGNLDDIYFVCIAS